MATLLEPTFSDQAGFYTDSFTLFLTSPNTGDTILYTIDGSEPDINILEVDFIRQSKIMQVLIRSINLIVLLFTLPQVF